MKKTPFVPGDPRRLRPHSQAAATKSRKRVDPVSQIPAPHEARGSHRLKAKARSGQAIIASELS